MREAIDRNRPGKLSFVNREPHQPATRHPTLHTGPHSSSRLARLSFKSSRRACPVLPNYGFPRGPWATYDAYLDYYIAENKPQVISFDHYP